MQRWIHLSGAAKLSITLAAFLALQLLLLAFPLTRIIIGSMLPIYPFHPWVLQLVMILLTFAVLIISCLAWAIQTRNSGAEKRAASIRLN